MVFKTESEVIIKIPTSDPYRACASILDMSYVLLKNEGKGYNLAEDLTGALNDIIRAIDNEGNLLATATKDKMKVV